MYSSNCATHCERGTPVSVGIIATNVWLYFFRHLLVDFIDEEFRAAEVSPDGGENTRGIGFCCKGRDHPSWRNNPSKHVTT